MGYTEESYQHLVEDNRKLREIISVLEAREADSKGYEWFLALAESLPDFIFVADAEGRMCYINRTHPQHTKDDVIGKKIFDVVPSEQHEAIRKAIVEVFTTNSVIEFESRGVGPENTISHYKNRYLPIVHNGKVELFCSIASDITGRKRSEEALLESEEKYRTLFESSRDAILVLDPKTGYIDCNHAATKLFGVSLKEEFLKLNPVDLSPEYQPDGSPSTKLAEVKIGRALEDGSHFFEWTHKKVDGHEFPATVLATRLNLGGRILLQGTIRDITDQKQAEEALRESKATAERYLNVAAEIILSLDVHGTITLINDSGHDLLGYENGELIGKNWFDTCLQKDIVGNIKEVFCKLMNGDVENVKNFENSILTKNGDIRLIYWHNTILKDDDGMIVGVLSSGEDITKRKQTEKALEESLERLKGFAQHSSEGVYRVDMARPAPLDLAPNDMQAWINQHAVVGDVNDALARMYGLTPPEMLGRPATDFAPNYGERVKRVLAHPDRRVTNDETEDVDKDGNPLYLIENYHGVVEDGHLHAIWGAQRDITDLKEAELDKEKLEIQLRQAQKMESVGRLAGGVAHDFNNMLGVILGYSETILEQVHPQQPAYASTKQILKAAERSADLIQQLLAFARKQTVAPKVLDLNETVGGMLKMLHRLIGEDIDLAWRPDKDLWPIMMDESQIDQILANLCVNARDAIVDVGKITIETANTSLDEEYFAKHPYYSPGEYILLAVSDDGHGMDKETQAKLFEPFFTTKALGEGTGLGLATVYGIVKQNKGFINVYSEPGKGTCFKIYLPRHVGKSEQLLKAADSAKPVEGGKETILLVEDEQDILDIATMMLEKVGYIILEAKTPGEAIRLAREHSGRIDLLMTDVVMPEMNGRDLAKNIMNLYPGIKRLFMSGYTANVIAHHGMLDEDVNFIQKPFRRRDLTEKVREVLDQA